MHGSTENQRDRVAAGVPLQYQAQVNLGFGQAPDGKVVIQFATTLVMEPDQARKFAQAISQSASPIVIAGQMPTLQIREA